MYQKRCTIYVIGILESIGYYKILLQKLQKNYNTCTYKRCCSKLWRVSQKWFPKVITRFFLIFIFFFNKYQALTRYTVAQLSPTGLLSGTNIDQEPFYKVQCSWNSLFVPLYHYIWLLHYIIWFMSMMFSETRHCGLCDVRPGPLQTGLQYHCHPAKVSTTPPPPHYSLILQQKNIFVFSFFLWDWDQNRACSIHFYRKACSEEQVEYSCQ